MKTLRQRLIDYITQAERLHSQGQAYYNSARRLRAIDNLRRIKDQAIGYPKESIPMLIRKYQNDLEIVLPHPSSSNYTATKSRLNTIQSDAHYEILMQRSGFVTTFNRQLKIKFV
jgi:glutamyl/glutaminyl-tRNA synthetase